MLAGISAPRLARAADPEVEDLKRQIEALMERVEELEEKKEPAVEPLPPAPGTVSGTVVTEGLAPPTQAGTQSTVKSRGSLKDEQQAAPRVDDISLDPKYRGFTRLPTTKVLIKFNAKPRVDASYDNKNSGDDNRFVTARIPVDGDPDEGGDGVFNINAKASQLRIAARAPELPGSPRFYYENDFFGQKFGGDAPRAKPDAPKSK